MICNSHVTAGTKYVDSKGILHRKIIGRQKSQYSGFGLENKAFAAVCVTRKYATNGSQAVDSRVYE